MFDAALRISLLRHLLAHLGAAKSLTPDQQIHVLQALLDVFDAVHEVHGTDPATIRRAHPGGDAESGIGMLEREVQRGIAELESEHRIPAAVQKAADLVVAYPVQPPRRGQDRRVSRWPVPQRPAPPLSTTETNTEENRCACSQPRPTSPTPNT